MKFSEIIPESDSICPQCGMKGCTCKPGKCGCKPKPGYPKKVDEAANPAQQAAIAIAKQKTNETVKEGTLKEIALKFKTIELSNDNIVSYAKNYFESNNIEAPHQKFISNVKLLSNPKLIESTENAEIQEFSKALKRLDTKKKIKVGDKFAVLSFEIRFAWREIDVLGFTEPKEVADIKLHSDGTINYIKFTDGDRYPRLIQATRNNNPIVQAVYFDDKNKAEKALTYLTMIIPDNWEIDLHSLVRQETKKDVTEEQLDELKCWPGYSRVQGVPAGASGSCKKKTTESVKDLVQIEYWQQDTQESGQWAKTKPMPRNKAEQILSSFPRGEIVDADQDVTEGFQELDEGVIEFFSSSAVLVKKMVDIIIEKLSQETRETKFLWGILMQARRGEEINPDDLAKANDQVKDLIWAAFLSASTATGLMAAGVTGGASIAAGAAVGGVAKSIMWKQVKDWINRNALDALLKIFSLAGKDLFKLVMYKIKSGAQAVKTASGYGQSQDIERMAQPGMLGIAEGENWAKHNNKRVGGMSKKSVASYRRSHPGSKIQTAVTTKPSKLKKGSKSAARRKSFCARMRGMKKHRTGAKTARDPNSNINKSLRRWHCESVQELQELVMIAEQFIKNNK
jgi:hypothetical protein